MVISSDGSSRAGGLRLYVNGRPASTEVVLPPLATVYLRFAGAGAH